MLRSVLHPKNAYMTILRAALSQLYGKAEGYTLQDLPDIIMERKIELCQQLLEVLDVIEPGLSRIRGIFFNIEITILISNTAICVITQNNSKNLTKHSK